MGFLDNLLREGTKDAARWKLQAPALTYEEWRESQREPDPDTVVWD